MSGICYLQIKRARSLCGIVTQFVPTYSAGLGRLAPAATKLYNATEYFDLGRKWPYK